MNVTKDEIKKKIQEDSRWLERAILAIFMEQTGIERSSFKTIAKNKRGFSSKDAPLMSRYADWLLKGNHLDEKHAAIARKMMIKYAGQLASIAERKIIRKMSPFDQRAYVLSVFPRALVEDRAEGSFFKLSDSLYIQLTENGRAVVARLEYEDGPYRSSMANDVKEAVSKAKKILSRLSLGGSK